MASDDDGDAKTDGRGTHGGGNMDVRNQQLLVVGRDVTSVLTAEQARGLAIVQLEFARDVSELAATAYEKLLLMLGAERTDRG